MSVDAFIGTEYVSVSVSPASSLPSLPPALFAARMSTPRTTKLSMMRLATAAEVSVAPALVVMIARKSYAPSGVAPAAGFSEQVKGDVGSVQMSLHVAALAGERWIRTDATPPVELAFAVSVTVARRGLTGSFSDTELIVLSTRRLEGVLDVRGLPA